MKKIGFKFLVAILCVVIGVASVAMAEEHTHNYGGWNVKTAATCSAAGTEVRICSECGNVESRSISKTSHNYGAWNVKTAATCSAAGTEVRICSACGDVESKSVPATGHSFGAWNVKTAATCSAAGTEVRICSVCGTVESNSIPKTSHNFGAWNVKTPATCVAAGTEVRICSECGTVETRAIPAAGSHNYGAWNVKTAATCTADGTEVRICSECGNVESKSIPATGHSFGAWNVKTAATCTAPGTEVRICGTCGEVESREIPAIAHTEVVDKAVAATCTTTGLTEGKHCSVCGTTTVAQEVTEKAAHDYAKKVVKPTETSKGYTKYTCEVCGDSYKGNYTDKIQNEVAVAAGTGAYGSIVTNVAREYEEYTAEVAVSEIDQETRVLVIVAAPEKDGTYATRNLHLSNELLSQLKAEEIDEIQFVVGSATLSIPVISFEDEMVQAMMVDGCDDFIMTLALNDAEIEKAVSLEYGVSIGFDMETPIDVTSIVPGAELVLLDDGNATACVNAEGVAYAAAAVENAWAFEVTEQSAYILIAE